MTLFEYILAIPGVFVTFGVALSLVVLLLFTRAGFTAFVFLAFAVVISALTSFVSGTTLAAIDFLYPQAVSVPGFWSLLLLVVLASLASTLLFDLWLEGLFLRVLKKLGMEISRIRAAEAFAEGLFIALALIVFARLLPEIGLSVVAAVIAGMTGAFVRYFVGLYLDEAISDDMDFLEEEDQDRISQRQTPPSD
ncbi:hypothetical protein Rxycam_02107 [Rubrobacter xylanophilus DSM 9941]|uniref:hypothetical protein n=1 Tax=Rubrobacter xylanophilus TaxID=49319 RepID=UPI001C6431FC|nr:hypothetical protein [Rubrobacter xylanophilus]QYJ16274.1 hypothetical protein Rxycam_02107 [Rubrobacter xylanophilus DSM 9941]